MQFEFYILDFVQKYMQNDILTNLLRIITYTGNLGIIWIVVSLLFILSKKHRKIGLTMVIGLLLCLVLGNGIIKPIVSRIRPYDINNSVQILIKKPKDLSFPSGHTLAAFTSAVIILLYNKKFGAIAIVFAILMAFSRIYFYIHFPTDVLAGIILGCIFAFASKKIYEYINNKFIKQKGENGDE